MKTILFICLAAAFALAVPSFTTPPSLTQVSPGNWQVQFAVSEYTDVEVSIVDMRDSTIVRRLAAGMLGAGAPAPFAKSSLSQTVAWDGKDDLDQAVTASPLSVRVRAGMSVSLSTMVGENAYKFGSKVMGLALDNADGSVYVFGLAGTHPTTTVRKFDGQGNYLRTVWPFPAGIASTDLSGYGINVWGSGSISPKASALSYPNISTTLITDQNSTLLPFCNNGELFLVSLPGLRFIKIKTDSRFPGTGASAPLISGRAMPGNYNTGGPIMLTLSPDGNYFLLSGIYYKTDSMAPDTGFWKDGQVFRVDAATGAISSLISIPSVPTTWAARLPAIGPQYGSSSMMAALHGTAFDASGRIYVCDRLNQRIGVYNAQGVYQGGIPVVDPDLVSVNPTTGEVYVVTRRLTGYHAGLVNIKKFPAFGGAAAEIASLNNIVNQVGEVFARPYAEKVYMVVSQSGGRTFLWFTSYSSVLGVEAQNSVWCIQDNGASLSIAKNFYSLSAGVNPGFDRVKVDRRTESVFIQDSWAGISKVEDWTNPRVLACSTSANKALNGPDFNISPDGLLWVREGTSYSGPITRYTMAHKHAPLNFASTGNNWLTPYVYSRYGQGYGERGFAIRKDGYVACTYMYDWAVYHVGSYGPAASMDTVKSGNEIIHPMPGACGGVEFDPAGNLYVGASIRSPSHVIPSGFASDNGYLCGVGAVVKYARGATGSISDGGAVATRTATGALRIYRPGFAPLSSNGPMYECACRNPRFDVDDYGRLFIPNAITQQVTVVDNDDNEILRFGEWGNMDSRGNGSGPAIPLAWPVGAAASDDFIYVTDMVNCRLLRIKMNFVLDNIPGIAQSAALKAAPGAAPLSLMASPNPFSPVSRIRVGMPSSQAVTLQVFDASGRLVRTIAKGTLRTGYSEFAWNGTDGFNRPAAPGMYVYRLTAGGKVLNIKTILAK